MPNGSGGMQMRLSPSDPRVFSADRDTAHNFGWTAGEVARRIEHKVWPTLHAVLPHLSDVELEPAMQAFIDFVTGAVDDPKEDMLEVLDRVGFFKTNPQAQVAVMATLGVLMSGVYFQGVREATLGGEGPCSNTKELVAAGERLHRLLTVPRWCRGIMRFYYAVRRAINAFKREQP